METFQIAIYAADHVFYEGPCESLIVPTSEGQYGIWAHHSNIISALIPGTLQYKLPGEEFQSAAESEGRVKEEGEKVLELVDDAERPEEIDLNRAKRDAAAAREAILQKRSIQEYYVAQSNLARAINRMKVKHHYTDAP